jgi:hypothetical protein
MGAAMICARAMVGGLFALLAMTSCGGNDDRAPGHLLQGDSGKVLVNAEPNGGPMAGVGYGGRVELVGDCLGIGGNTIIWPHGTEIVSDGPLVVDVPGVGQVTIGDQVTGGAVHYGDYYLPDGIDAIPSGCPTDVFAYYPE